MSVSDLWMDVSGPVRLHDLFRPDSTPPPAPVPPGSLWTADEVAAWSSRADSGWTLGETNSPNAWTEIVNRKNTFKGNHLGNLYAGPPLNTNGQIQQGSGTGEPTISEREYGLHTMCAAFYALVKPNASDAAECRTKVAARIVAQMNKATYPRLNADYNGPWAREGSNAVDDGNPTFIVARLWVPYIFAIDCIGLDAFTVAQKDQIAEFLYWWAELAAYAIHRKMKTVISGRLSNNFTWTGSLAYDWSPFTAGPVANNAVRWANNRRSMLNGMSAYATELIARIGWVTPATYLTVTDLRARAAIHVKEAITIGVYTESSDPSSTGKAGFAFDFNRGSLAMWYPVAALSGHVLVADLAARRGDRSLYDWTTRAGTPDGSGSNRGSVCRTGDPDKSLLLAALLISRHYATTYNKSTIGDNGATFALNGSSRVHDASTFPRLNLYYGNAELRGNYLFSVKRSHIFPSNPGSSGGMRAWFYGWAMLPDGPFMAHNLGVNPYVGA